MTKHENIASFFVNVLGADKKEAVEIACKMEHIVSEKIFNNMIKLTDFINQNAKVEIKNLYD